MAFQKATREKLWLKLLFAGSSGSGKTYSALRVATGIVKKTGGRIAAVDTENGRIRYYANEFDFEDSQLEAPYTPQKYIDAIDEAVDEGFEVLVIDSISHEWQFCLDLHSRMAGNSYTNWAKVTPKHNEFMEKILQSPIHVIATVRGKDEYVLEEKNGKQVPKKVGLGYKQRDNIEYEYTVTLNIEQDTHIATVTKDNTHIFENKYDILTEKDGTALYEWANTGSEMTAKPPKKIEVSVSEAKKEIKSVKESIPEKEVELETQAEIVVDSEEPDFGDDDVSPSDLQLQITEIAKNFETSVKKDFSGQVKAVLITTANYNKCDDINKLREILAIAESM